MTVHGLFALILLATLGQDTSPPGVDEPASMDRSRTLRSFLQSALTQFDQAVAVGDHGSPEAQRLYRQALEGFETLIKDGIVNGYVYYNAANAHMRLGEIGAAIVDYRRALRLVPGDSNVRRNLEFARSLCKAQVAPTPASAIAETVFFWHFETSPMARTRAAMGAYLTFWLLLLIRIFLRRRLTFLLWFAAAAALVALAVGLSVTWTMRTSENRQEAVIVETEAVLRKGNGEGYQPQLERPLPEGVEFRILESREDVRGNLWHNISLRDGKSGWLRADRVEVI